MPSWLIGAVVAVVIVVVAIGGWFWLGPGHRGSGTKYSDDQVADAKANVCAAYGKVHQAVLITTGRTGGEDFIANQAIAANARIALFDGGEYLLSKLNAEPATPPELAAGVRSLAAAYQQLAIDYLAEVPGDESQASLMALEEPNTAVFQGCQ